MTAIPAVLFVCVKNGGKSQMAAGLMRHAAEGRIEVYSAGTAPGESLNALSVQSLLEVGVDIRDETPKPIDPRLLRAVDLVITLGREAHVDPVDRVRIVNWDTDEPSERGIGGIERMRLVRDDINTRVQHLLAERFARQRLNALARVEGKAHTGKPTVLFLCTHNAGRSQMALGFFTHLAADNAVAWSGGSEPGNEINPAAVEAMAEVGIDITTEFPKPWTEEILQAADVIITMGCGDACPLYPGRRYEEWDLDDPAGLDVAAVRPIREEIETRVRHLLAELDIPAS
ncbi:low molecular weight phosphatase family protein [Nocardia sp. NPDC057455]|uniref:arsenate reductase/protein-tyrosine-phosphatase family protein n=1 Tax=Nocardia sp. NPDC057455 TaxID=3346138 RepID=UPI003671B4CB